MQEFNENDSKIVAVKEQSVKIVEQAQTLVVTNDAQAVVATEVLGTLKGMSKQVEETRQFFVGGLNEQVRKFNASFKKLSEPLAEADKIVRNKILAYRQEQERKRQAEQARIDKEAREEQERLDKQAAEEQAKLDKKAEKEGTAPWDIPQVEVQTVTPITIAKAPTVINSMAGMASVKKVWKFYIKDESLIPRKYLMVNETLIRDQIRLGVREIAGVEIKQEESLAIR